MQRTDGQKTKRQLKKSDKWCNGRLALKAVRILCVVEHVVRLILEGAVGIVRIKGQARCRHANERWTENKGAAKKN